MDDFIFVYIFKDSFETIDNKILFNKYSLSKFKITNFLYLYLGKF